MNEEQMVDMQKHIEGLRKENEILINLAVKKEMALHAKSNQFRITIGSFVIVLTFLGVWVYALYYANGLLATDNQTKENWKRSAIQLLNDNAECYERLDYAESGVNEAIDSGFIQKLPPPMIKEIE